METCPTTGISRVPRVPRLSASVRLLKTNFGKVWSVGLWCCGAKIPLTGAASLALCGGEMGN